MTDTTVIDSFSAAAATYDRHATVQRAVADDLVRLCPADARSVLELGCGTGYYTRLLAGIYPDAAITAADASQAMLDVARAGGPAGVRWVRARAESWSEGGYDLITANAAVQWLDDLPSVLERLGGLLVPGGSLVFSCFGPGTYRELRAALAEATGIPVAIASDTFPSADTLDGILRRQFRGADVVRAEYVDDFSSVRDLLRAIRATGTRGRGASHAVRWTPGLLARVDEHYHARYGAIRATFDVALCRAQRD